jgi:N-glycosylase/DNA lyase
LRGVSRGACGKKSKRQLVELIEKLKPVIGDTVRKRISEFMELNGKGNEEWFSEMCFCILTANSSAEMGIKIQNELGSKFLSLSEDELRRELKRLGYRFYNVRARYIVEARRYSNIKDIVQSFKPFEAREWLVKNVKGLGYKEASHFLRNVGYMDFAILDRHILRVMHDYGLIEMPKSLSRKRYLEIEEVFRDLAVETGLSAGGLDLYIWYMRTGEVLK